MKDMDNYDAIQEIKPETSEHPESKLDRFSSQDIERFNDEFNEYYEKLNEITKRGLLLEIVTGPEQKFPYKIGFQRVENSPFSSDQLLAILFLSGKFDMKEGSFVSRKREDQNVKLEEKFLNIREAIENKILSGLKILDLGCGKRPYFSYLCRMMGATVYTADMIAASDFEGIEHGIAPNSDAADFHIQLDLSNGDAVDKIEKASGGKFNFVTEAHLNTVMAREVNGRSELVSFSGGKEIAKRVLIPEGVYFNPYDDKLCGRDSL
jgi:hypothetical protein